MKSYKYFCLLFCGLILVGCTAKPKIDPVASDSNYLFAVCSFETARKGYINNTGKLVIRCRFDSLYIRTWDLRNSAMDLVPAEIWTEKKDTTDETGGYIDKAGRMVLVVPKGLYHPTPFVGGLATVCTCEDVGDVDGDGYDDCKVRYGVIDRTGKLIIQPKFSACLVKFSEDLMAVAIEEVKDDGKVKKWGYINRQGKWVIPPKYGLVDSFRLGLARVAVPIGCQFWGYFDPDRKIGYINPKGQVVVPLVYDELSDFNEGLAAARKGKLWGYVNSKGKECIALQFEDACDFAEGLAVVRSGGKYGLINAAGKFIVKPIYEVMEGGVVEGLIGVKIGEHFGFIDVKGNLKIQPRFDDVRSFSEGLAAVKVQGKWGYIDKQGKMIIPPQFYEAEDFIHGLAIVNYHPETDQQLRFKTDFINRKGQKVTNEKLCPEGDRHIGHEFR